ncbi:MAG: ABC transporter permease [Vicinamibacterales bacterium]
MARLDRALYRLFLRLYPADFRRTHAQELEQIYAWCMTTSRQRRGLVPARVRGLADAVRGAIALRTGGAPPGNEPPRSSRIHRLASSLTQDTRFALRTFRRSPLFFAGLLVVLALGIGANAAVFSLVQAVLLEPLPYGEPDRVMRLWRAHPEPASTVPLQARPPSLIRQGTTGFSLWTWRDQSRAFLEDVAGVTLWDGNLAAQFDMTIDERAERLRGALVTPNFFTLLGVDAQAGRVFTPADEAAGAGDLVVISNGLWRRAFGGDPGVIGRTVSLVRGRADRGARPHTIVGVLPAAFRFTYPLTTDVWAIRPWADISRTGSAIEFNGAVGRLRPGVTVEQAAAAFRSIPVLQNADRVAPADRDYSRLEPIRDAVLLDVRPSLWLLGSVAALLLVITCATVANALLVRVAERQRELAVRASLGAGLGRLRRQLLTEGVLLSLVGTLTGTALAAAALPVFRAFVPPTFPRADGMAVNGWLLAFGGAIAATVTTLATALPALRGPRADLMDRIRQAAMATTTSREGRRWRLGLVAAQAVVATSLLIGATFLLASFWRLGRVDLGYDPQDVVTVEMRLLDRRYRSRDAIRDFEQALLARVRAIPGVADAGLTTAVPFRGVDFVRGLQRTDNPKLYFGNSRTVDAGYFAVMRIPVLRGRLFGPEDTATSEPAIILSESFARMMFGAEDAVGRVVDDGRIVGVVGDVRYAGLARTPEPAFYTLASQNPVELICLVVRPASDAAGLGDALRRAVHDVDPSIPAMDVTTIDRIIEDSVADRRFYTTTTTTFAGLALVLTAAGLIVVISRSVVERRREMAIRTALGAGSGRLVRLVAAQGLLPVMAGTAMGLAGAVLGARLLEPFLFGISPRAPVVFVAGAGVVLVVATVACVLPARRLATIAPAPILRGD